MIEVTSQVEPGFRGNDIVRNLLNSPEYAQIQASLPPGFRIEPGGAFEDSQEGAQQLSVCLGISLLLIIMCLVIQYNGWIKPLIILTTLPLALIGALPGLYFTGNPLGFMPQLGILSLFGIVLNTWIIEFADLLVSQKIAASSGTGPVMGLTRQEFEECLVDAGRQRLLPIFLTTATTVGGLLPLALFGGPLWEGMAWCMIFGLCIATLLTLLVIPALYGVFAETFRIQMVPGPEREIPALSPVIVPSQS
jgi:multidrug efflux pump subunit AcrB